MFDASGDLNPVTSDRRERSDDGSNPPGPTENPQAERAVFNASGDLNRRVKRRGTTVVQIRPAPLRAREQGGTPSRLQSARSADDDGERSRTDCSTASGRTGTNRISTPE